MNRRSFLRTLLASGGAALTGGCLDEVGLGSGVVATKVQHVEPSRLREQKRSIVEFDESTQTVQILGWMPYGSSSCNYVGIESTDYDATEEHLRVTFTSKSDTGIPFLPTGCTADMAATWYEARIEFADSLPQTVTVIENRGGKISKRTVNRQTQRELCTNSHPPDSAEAAAAHWTCPDNYIKK